MRHSGNQTAMGRFGAPRRPEDPCPPGDGAKHSLQDGPVAKVKVRGLGFGLPEGYGFAVNPRGCRVRAFRQGATERSLRRGTVQAFA